MTMEQFNLFTIDDAPVLEPDPLAGDPPPRIQGHRFNNEDPSHAPVPAQWVIDGWIAQHRKDGQNGVFSTGAPYWVDQTPENAHISPGFWVIESQVT